MRSLKTHLFSQLWLCCCSCVDSGGHFKFDILVWAISIFTCVYFLLCAVSILYGTCALQVSIIIITSKLNKLEQLVLL
jgi:hypothetical protein